MRELSPQQETALGLFLAGRTVTEVAEEIGVCRQTVSLWLNQDPLFRATLNARRRELWAGAADQLRALLPQAVEALADALQGPDRLRAAGIILKATGLADMGPPVGPVATEEIETEDRERAAVLTRRSLFVV